MAAKFVFRQCKGADIARFHLQDNKVCTTVVLYGGKNKYRLPNSSSFCHRKRTEDSNKEALSIIKSWNEDISPTYWMTDYCTEEFKAMENIFEGMLNVNYFNITSLLRLKDRLR